MASLNQDLKHGRELGLGGTGLVSANGREWKSSKELNKGAGWRTQGMVWFVGIAQVQTLPSEQWIFFPSSAHLRGHAVCSRCGAIVVGGVFGYV